jgi:hypothetical protein
MSILMKTGPSEIGTLASEAIRELTVKATGTSNVSVFSQSGSVLEWGSISKAGWDLVGVVDEGEGATLRDLTEIAQAWGERCIPIPFLETVLAKRHSAAALEWDGPVTLALPIPSAGQGGGFVPFGHFASIGFLTALGLGNGTVVVPPAGTDDDFDLLASAVEVDAITTMSEDAAREVAVVYAAAAVGAARRLLELGVSFVKEREQFGRPVGSFQAVKHHLANALIAAEEADTSIIRASLLPEEALRSAHFAVRRSIDAAELVQQVHGGLGFTWEFGLHFYLRHILMAREIVVGLTLYRPTA